ncbi:MAG: sodium-dependent transporter [Gammaproteobacteria bacterium]|nr:sodium-dependent transporter [Gammaproteobacteria bacterium]MDH3431351.1 sodium-dependent transporter [Gammaproteobacteria bacterium]
MTTDSSDKTWSSGLTFILAAVGAAVGLGNIWKFPYVAGVSGGGAFVLIYVVCVVFVAIPILIAELLIGRCGSGSPPVAMRKVAERAGRSRRWSIVGFMGMIVGYLIATYYSVIAGWTLIYIFKAANGFGGATALDVAQQFEDIKASPGTMAIWHTVFIVLALFIVSRGLRDGIERVVKALMPALFTMLLIMIGYAAIAGDFRAGVEFLFSVDFSKISGEVVLAAIGQAFFSISVAMGLMMVYGAYVPRDISLTRSAVIIAGADTLIALLAGLMIFPIVFANGLDPAEGPGLIFKTLPTAFVGMPGGSIFGALFFLLLAFAAITSIIAIIEPIVAYAEDRWHLRRTVGCVVFGFLGWLIGIASVLSFNAWKDFTPLGMFDVFAGKTIYDLIDYFTANIMMPLGAILIALFVGWRMQPEVFETELDFKRPWLLRTWVWTLRVVAPLAILGILISGLK